MVKLTRFIYQKKPLSYFSAADRIRTCNLRFTKAAHSQLCYNSMVPTEGIQPSTHGV